jgi:hypothetical protein
MLIKNIFFFKKKILYSRSTLILWVSVTFSDWHVAATKRCPVGMTNDTLDFVIQLDCGAGTLTEVLFSSASPFTVHFIIDAGLLRLVSQLNVTNSPCFASSGPLTWTREGPTTRHVKDLS